MKTLRRRLLRWYAMNKRALPWREERDPYRILVSEIMLQQTQVDRVRKKYSMFLKRFPTIKTLAGASVARVILAWQGMGYNNRALRLRDLARRVVEYHSGVLPGDIETLTGLPGVGRYTASAVASFAFGKRVAAVDVNVRRVFSRIFWRMNRVDETKHEGSLWKLAERILPRRNAADWNQALMDFGATVCTPAKPRCLSCPVMRCCASYRSLSQPEARARSSPRPRERLYGGLPVRIYRGRIVEALRQHNGKGIEIGRLGTLVKSTFSKSELPWLASIVTKLQVEGLAELNQKRTLVRLPQP